MSDKQYKYIYGIGKTALDIPESEIRYAMENTKSNAQAARFLKVSFTTYKKYARLYIDRETDKTLYELHKNQFGIGIPKDVQKANKGIYSITNILEGKHPNYPTWKLRNRLLALAIVLILHRKKTQYTATNELIHWLIQNLLLTIGQIYCS